MLSIAIMVYYKQDTVIEWLAALLAVLSGEAQHPLCNVEVMGL